MARLTQHTAVAKREEEKAPELGPIAPPKDTFAALRRSLVHSVRWAVRAIAGYFTALLGVTRDASLLSNPEQFAPFGSPKPTAVTPGTVVAVYQNQTLFKQVCHVRLETYQTNDGILILDTENTRCTLKKALIVKAGMHPAARVVLPPNSTLYADCVDSSAGNQSTFSVVVVPLDVRDY